MTKREQSILIESNEEPLEMIIPLDENDELREHFKIWSEYELDFL